MVMSSLDGLNFDDSDCKSASYSTEYIRRRLLAVHPRKPYGGRRSIRSISKTNHHPTIVNAYLLLIPVTVDKRTIKWNKLVAEFFDQDDLMYIKSILYELLVEEDQQKTGAIKNIHHSSTSKDKDDEDSLPRTRSSFSNQYLSPPRKFNIIENKYFKSEVKIKNFILFPYTSFFILGFRG
jgi:hypothetical protein